MKGFDPISSDYPILVFSVNECHPVQKQHGIRSGYVRKKIKGIRNLGSKSKTFMNILSVSWIYFMDFLSVIKINMFVLKVKAYKKIILHLI